jgi:hypothetical protein
MTFLQLKYKTYTINKHDCNVCLFSIRSLVFDLFSSAGNIYRKVLTGNIREPTNTIRGAPEDIYKRRMISFLERRNI